MTSRPTTHFAGLMGENALRLFSGPGPGVTELYYAFKAHPGTTDFLLDMPPNETYPEGLAEMRAAWHSVRDLPDETRWLTQLRADRDAMAAKHKQHRVRYLFCKKSVEAYARGQYGDHLLGATPPVRIRADHLSRCARLLQENELIEVGYTQQPFELMFGVSEVGVCMSLRGVQPATLWGAAFLGAEIIKTFQEEFERIWDTAIRDRSRLIAWFNYLAKYACG